MGPDIGRNRRALKFEGKWHDELRARMEQMENSFAALSHADNRKQQIDINLTMVEPLSVTG